MYFWKRFSSLCHRQWPFISATIVTEMEILLQVKQDLTISGEMDLAGGLQQRMWRAHKHNLILESIFTLKPCPFKQDTYTCTVHKW